MKNKQIAQPVIDWYKQHGRKHLPWQKQRNPYRVWVSEIMLQQTQVATVIPYYQRFMQRFPTIESLAQAELDEVLQLWTGLGYYARGRNLHRTAQIIAHERSGLWPKNLCEMQSLPGIGRSTAGAILSLGMGIRGVILDGNVKRVLARMHCLKGWPDSGETNKTLWQLADQYTPSRGIKSFNQAMMDIGATLCSKKNPTCSFCPLNTHCLAFQRQVTDQYPQPKTKIQRPKRSTSMLIIRRNESEVLLLQRPPQGIWGGLWSFPEAPKPQKAEILNYCKQQLGIEADIIQTWNPIKHTFSHFHLAITPVELIYRKSRHQVAETRKLIWHDLNTTAQFGLATPVKKLLHKLAQNSEEPL